MKSIMKSTVYVLSALVIFVMFTGCTPGKAQTKGNDYAGSFESEDYEAFDRESGDDEIPAYKEDRKSSSDKYTRNNKKDEDKSYRVKSSGEKDESSYADDDRKSGNDTKGVSEDYENDDNSGYRETNTVSDSFYQKGYASWYGREFHGKITASGEKFDMNLKTGAHKTLPFGTIVEVTNLENGKTVKIKINDRGPYRGNRIIDLSYGAARELEMVKKGEIKVGINVVKMGDNTVAGDRSNNSDKYVEAVADDDSEYADAKPDKKARTVKEDYDSATDYDNLKLQAGAFYSRRNAESVKEKIEGLTDRPVKIVRDGDYYKVRIEGIKSKKEQERIRDVLSSENISSFGVE